MAESVTIRAGDFQVNILLPKLLDLKVTSWRKLVKLMRLEPQHNEETEVILVQYFRDVQSDAKEQWRNMSLEFTREWEDLKKYNDRSAAFRAAKTKNRSLERKLKAAKARYDRTLKYESILKGD